MRVALAIAKKDMVQLRRDMTALFFTVFFPLVVGVLFGMIFSRAHGGGEGVEEMPIAAADLDGSAFSLALLDALDATPELWVHRFASEADAADAVRRGAAPAAVVLGAGLGARLDGLLTGERVEIGVIVDPSRAAEAGLVRGVVTQTAFAEVMREAATPERSRAALARVREVVGESDAVPAMQRTLVDQMTRAAERLLASEGEFAAGASATGGGFVFEPVRVTVRAASGRAASGAGQPANAFEITIPQAAAWALLGCVTGFGMSIVHERKAGTLDRLALAPCARWHVLAGKALGCFVTALAVVTLLLAIGVVFLGVRPDSWGLLGLGLVCSCFGFVGVMMVLAVLCGTSAGAEGLTRGALIVMAMLGGAGIPLAFMPEWLRTASGLSPFKWVIVALEGAVWRDATLGELLVPCGVLAGIGLVGMALGARMMGRPGK